MKSLPIAFLFAFLLSCQITDTSSTNPIRIPGEFEPQEAIWLGYRSIREEGYFEEETHKILRAIDSKIKVNLVVEGDSLIPEGKTKLHEMGFDTTRISLFIQESTDA